MLRFYSWAPPTLSLGYFQKYDEVPAAAKQRFVVRRITGGGAIHHDREVTFSISAPASHQIYRGPVAESYERIHGVIVKALRNLDVESKLCGEASASSDRAGTGMCFHASTPLDLVWNGRKGVGSAQRRKNGHVLHHGSIKLGTTELEGDIGTLQSVREGIEPEHVARELVSSLSEAFEVEFETTVPDSDETDARQDARRALSRS